MIDAMRRVVVVVVVVVWSNHLGLVELASGKKKPGGRRRRWNDEFMPLATQKNFATIRTSAVVGT